MPFLPLYLYFSDPYSHFFLSTKVILFDVCAKRVLLDWHTYLPMILVLKLIFMSAQKKRWWYLMFGIKIQDRFGNQFNDPTFDPPMIFTIQKDGDIWDVHHFLYFFVK